MSFYKQGFSTVASPKRLLVRGSPHSPQRPFKIEPIPNLPVSNKFSTVRSVTPDSLIKMQNLFHDSSDCKIFTPAPAVIYNSSTALNTRVLENPLKIDSSNKKKFKTKMKVIAKSDKMLNSEEKKAQELKYSEFKEYHCLSYDKRNKSRNFFFGKGGNAKRGCNKIKRIEFSFKNSKKTEQSQDGANFLKKTIYSKPALTYAEKLFRLNQVSIF